MWLSGSAANHHGAGQVANMEELLLQSALSYTQPLTTYCVLHLGVVRSNVQVLLVAMALPTATILTRRGQHHDVPVCLTFGVFNLAFAGGLLLLHVLIQSPVALKHALMLFLAFALLDSGDLNSFPAVVQF